ncbi:MAG TPA: M15 family metallopeptidase [Cryomorphaceae bacterium]|nr:M15 family metallopeptidase [Cryomorphaceae bacterium]
MIQLFTRHKRTASAIVLTLICESFISVSYAQTDFVSRDTILKFGIIEPIYFSSENFVGDTIEGYEAKKVLLSAEAASALALVEAELAHGGFGLKVLDGYRPQIAVDHFLKWSKISSDTVGKSRYYPNVPKDQLFVKGYIAEKSGHSRGSAVDLTLFDLATGKELDMGSIVDHFGPISHPETKNVSAVQHKNRQLLRNAMIKAGFEPLETEWWHFVLINEPYPNTYFRFPVK